MAGALAPPTDTETWKFLPPTNATSAGAYTAGSRRGPGTQAQTPLMLAQRP